jgi:hypothetical protein
MAWFARDRMEQACGATAAGPQGEPERADPRRSSHGESSGKRATTWDSELPGAVAGMRHAAGGESLALYAMAARLPAGRGIIQPPARLCPSRARTRAFILAGIGNSLAQ